MYTKTFDLNPRELELVESALSKEIHKLSVSRQTIIESTIKPADEIDSVKEYDQRIKEIRELLGKFHNQKTWYHPKDEIYVSG